MIIPISMVYTFDFYQQLSSRQYKIWPKLPSQGVLCAVLVLLLALYLPLVLICIKLYSMPVV